MPEEVSASFDPEVYLNDDAVGRYRYKWFYSVHSNYVREKSKSSKTSVRAQLSGVPLKELSCAKLGRLKNLRTHFKEYP